MKIESLEGRILDDGNSIICAALINAEKWVLLLKSGQVMLADLRENKSKALFKVVTPDGIY